MTGTENEASKLNLDDTIFTVTASKNSNSNNVGLYSELRLYAGNSLTISINSGTIQKIKITKTSGSGIVTSNGETITESDGYYIINGSSFTIQNNGTSQWKITSIEIVYVANA